FQAEDGIRDKLVTGVQTCALPILAWQRAGHRIPVSVNISMRDLVDPEFPEMIATLVRAAQAPPSLLVLEITESLIMTEPERAIRSEESRVGKEGRPEWWQGN